MIMDGGSDKDTDADRDNEFVPGCYELDVSPNPVSKFGRLEALDPCLQVHRVEI